MGVDGFPAEESIEDFVEGGVFEGFFGVGVGLTHGGSAGLDVLIVTSSYYVLEVCDWVLIVNFKSHRSETELIVPSDRSQISKTKRNRAMSNSMSPVEYAADSQTSPVGSSL